MITLVKDGIVMEVATELHASVFIRSGYKRVEAPVAQKQPERNFATEEEAEVETAPNAEPESDMPVSDEAPKRRRRRAK